MNVANRNSGLSIRINRKMFRFTLFVGLLSGLVGMCVDIDHFFCGRCAHIPLLIIALCVAGYYIARLGGLYYRMVLEKKKE